MRPAEVGGHIWIRGRNSAFVAPICKSCNYHKNANRMQGSGSQLKHHTVVVDIGMTKDMRTATRRIAVQARNCDDCGSDISSCPSHHTVCLGCWNRDKRPCQECGVDISDRPSNHKVCYECYSRSGETCNKRKASPNESSRTTGASLLALGAATGAMLMLFDRPCQECGVDISDRPSNHKVCYECYSRPGETC